MMKKQRKLVRFIAVLAIVGLAAMVGNFILLRTDSPVGGGYRLYRADSDSVVLCGPDGTVVVPERVSAIGRTESVIVGRTKERDVYQSEIQHQLGYFVIEVRSGKTMFGLSREELVQHMNVSKERVPRLWSPLWWALLP
jgi:hypothetical protein